MTTNASCWKECYKIKEDVAKRCLWLCCKVLVDSSSHWVLGIMFCCSNWVSFVGGWNQLDRGIGNRLGLVVRIFEFL